MDARNTTEARPGARKVELRHHRAYHNLNQTAQTGSRLLRNEGKNWPGHANQEVVHFNELELDNTEDKDVVQQLTQSGRA